MVSNSRGITVVVPLQYIAVGEHRYIVGTNWSRPNHPLWSSWLIKRPQCRINIDGTEFDCHATLMREAARDFVWSQILARSPYQADCERKSGRQPRVFRLDTALTDAHRRP
jgi:hypothetical protein